METVTVFRPKGQRTCPVARACYRWSDLRQQVKPAQLINDCFAMLNAVRSDVGIALPPEFLARSDFKNGTLEPLCPHVVLEG